MTWVNLSAAFTYGSKLTSTQMQNLRDNLPAAFNKDSGAPVLANGYIVYAMLATPCVYSENIANSQITAAQIATGQVTEAKLDTASVTTVKIKTVAETTGVSGTITTVVHVTLVDYCFAPNIHATGTDVRFSPSAGDVADTVYRVKLILASGSEDYHIRYRYITASDEPFLFAIREKVTGKILHLWVCDDPPHGCWGLDKAPDDFIPPVMFDEYDDNIHEQIILFKQDHDQLIELGQKAAQDKKIPCNVLSDGFDFDKDKNLFVSKNLITI